MTAEKKPLDVMRIAGHSFVLGVCVTPKQDNDGHCGRHWLDIRNCTSAEVGKTDIAHYGTLTATEFTQIETQRKAEDAATADAMENLLE